MGLYATTTALATRMLGVTFDTATTALASAMIDDAEAEVNKYLSKRYDLSSATFQTATSIPPLVRQLTQRLAEGYTWKGNSRGGKESLARGNDLIKEVKDNLTLIKDFKCDLLNTAGSLIAESSSSPFRVQCNTTNYTPTFNEDDELTQAIDSDKLDDIATTRD